MRERIDSKSSRARTHRLESGHAWPGTTYQAWVSHISFSVRMSLAGIEPVGFRVKSDLRNHQAIVQPRLYDCLMVTQITLNTEPHGFDPCQGHSYGKADMGYPGLIRSPWPGVSAFESMRSRTAAL